MIYGVKMSDIIYEIIQNKKNNRWWMESEARVINKYGPIFHSSNIQSLAKDIFQSFLLIKNNYHWEGIHRQQNLITSDMDKLKNAITMLLDESKSLKDRLDFLFPQDGKNFIKGLGKAVVTPILLVAYPKKYGVWNAKSEAALKKLKLFPDLKSKDPFSIKYLKVNQVLLDLSEKYSVSLWQLDGILGEIAGNSPFPQVIEEEQVENGARQYGFEDVYNFSMEKHLEDFLIANWEKTEISENYELIESEGDLQSQQFQTSVGFIDILARHRKDGSYLVIELKKGLSSDAVIGQILRYIAWVKRNLASGKEVKGLVIAPEVDEKLELALSEVDQVELLVYKIDFKLHKPNLKR